MKNIKYSALVAIAAIAASCAKESTVIEKETIKDIPMEPMCIQTGDESETKTSLNGQTVNWTEGDQIAVYSNMDYSTGYKFSATNIKDINRNTATFSGEVPAGTESFFAVYPPERVSSASASGAVVTIPSDQTPAAGTFYEELNITIAKGRKTPGKSDVGTIRFRNVCSYVKFTVPAYVSDVKSVKISSDNAIAGNLTVDYTGENPSSTIAPDGAKSISMSGSFRAGETFIFVIAPGTVSNFKIDITTDSGNWTRTVSSGFTAYAGKPVNLGTVDFKQVELKATASHIYQNGILVGTNLSVNLGLLKYVSNFNFVVKKGDTTVRSYSRESSEPVASSTVSFAWKDYADYPYLPQGEYTIEGSYTRPGGSTQAISGTFTVTEKPKFTVNATGMTSYSYYLAGNSTQANACDAETIYSLGGTAKISDAILNNANYSSLKGSYSYTLDNAATDAGDKTGQSWAAHTITATYTFDGVTVTSPKLTCHVTGLPYKKDFTSDKGTDGWSGLNTDNNKYAVCLGYKYGSGTITYNAFSPSFNLPKSTNVKYTAIHYCGATGGFSPSGTIYSGVTDNNTTVQTQSKSISGDTWYLSGVKSSFTLEDSITMSSNSKISLSGSCEARRAVQNYVELARFEITYR